MSVAAEILPDETAERRLERLGEEIWRQTEGEVAAFVHCVGTAASSRGVATVLKRHHPDVRFVAVEPAESQPLSGGPVGPHGIDGVGIGYVPPLWDPSVVDEFEAVATDEAKAMARRLAREEGLWLFELESSADIYTLLSWANRVRERLGALARNRVFRLPHDRVHDLILGEIMARNQSDQIVNQVEFVIALLKQIVEAGMGQGRKQRAAIQFGIGHHQRLGYIQHAHSIFGTLEVTRHPEQVIGKTAKHQ